MHTKNRAGFTLLEILVATGILSVLFATILGMVGPKKVFISARNVERTQNAREIKRAMEQYAIKNAAFPNAEQIGQGEANRKSICRKGVTNDTSCINADALVDENYLVELPVDPVEPCMSYTGYDEFLQNGVIQAVAVHMGKLKGDSALPRCILDTIAPIVMNLLHALLGDTVTITWITDEASNSQVRYGLTTSYGNISTLDPTLLTDHSITLMGLLPYTLYHYQALSRDAAGNIVGSIDATFTTSDTTPPVFTSGPTVTVSDTIAAVTWDTDENANSQVEYGTTTSYGNTNTLDTLLTTSHTQNLTNLTPNTLYHAHARSRDSFGNLGISADVTFTTLPDTSPPAISAITTLVTGSDLTISWNTNEAASSQVAYGLTDTYGNTTTPDASLLTSHSQTITGLSANTLYHYRIESRDVASNLGISPDHTVNIQDATAPTASAIAASAVTFSTATVSWTTNEGSITQVEYGTTTAYGNTTTLDSTLTTSHSQALTGLTPGTLYHYRVKLRDAAGNAADSIDTTFTTPVTPVISSVTATSITAVSATVTWTTDTLSNTRVDYGTTMSYGRNASNASLVTSHTRTITGLNPGTLYHYRVTSTDASGFSADSGATDFTFTTLSDATPPTFSSFGVTVNAAGNQATITWRTNEPATKQVEYDTVAGPPYGSASAEDMTLATIHSRTMTGLTPDTVNYHYRTVSTDAAGNTGYASDRIFDTKDPALTVGPTVSTLGDSATITWTTNEASHTRVNYGPTASYGSSSTSNSLVTSHARTITGLTENTLYHYQVVSNDAYGNSMSSGDFTFTTAEDATPPTFSNFGVSVNATGNQATITWRTNEPATKQVEYDTVAGPPYGSASAEDMTLATIHSRTMTGLTPDTVNYHYRTVSTDAAGNTGYSSPDRIFDTKDPLITVGQTVSGITANSATITWTTDEASHTRVNYGLTTSYGSSSTNNSLVSSHTRTITGLLPNRLYHYRVMSNDAYGNSVVSADGTFTTDITPPTLSSIASSISGGSATITWTTNEGATTQVEYGTTTGYGNTTTFDALLATSHSQMITGLAANTQYHYRVKSQDGNGNLATSADYTFTTSDSTPPAISAVTSGGTTDTITTITWTTDEAADTQIEYGLTTSYGSTTTLNTTAVTSHSQNITGLASNTLYHYRVKSRDAAGNLAVSTDTTFTTTDINPPVISSIIAGGIGESTATIIWTTNEASTTQVEYGLTTSYGGSTTLNPSPVTNHSQAMSSLTPSTLYHYRVKSRDPAGNLATSGDNTFTTAADSVAPVISAVQSSSVTENGATVTWTTNEPADTQVEYGLTTSYGSLTLLDASLSTSHSQSLSGLLPNAQYHYRVKSRDAMGNLAISNNFTFTTVDTTAPTITTGPSVPSVTATTATISWVTNETADTQVQYGPTTQYENGITINSTAVTNHSLVLTGLLTDALYHYRVKSRDPAGNLVTSGDFTFQTDGTPPVLSSIDALTPTHTTATITWSTNEAADTQVEYGTTTAYGNTTTLNTTLATSHNQILSGLQPLTLYHYRVKSRDAALNLATSGDFTFTTPADTTAPVLTSITSSSITTTQATITWTTDEAADTQIEYGLTTSYGSTTTLNTTAVTSHSQNITGLASNTLYHYRVKSRDAAGNPATSGDSTFTTSP